MASELRKTGISVVGDIPWGTHLCHFYETKQDLLDTLVPYFKAGLESNEFCTWVVSDDGLITVEEAKGALAQAVPDLDRHLGAGHIEVLNASDWYLDRGLFSLEKVAGAWDAKLKQALALGYEGMRVSGDTFWLREKDWKDFCAYENQLNDSVVDRRMNGLCTYPLAKSGAAEVLNIVQAHQFAIARRRGEWEIIETPQLAQAKAEIRKLNEELEQRVVERTNQLVATNEALISEIDQRRRVEEELRERAAELTEAQRVAKIGNWILNLPTDKVTWSEELFRIFEVEELNFDGHYESFVSRIHPDDQPRVLRTNAQSRIEGSPFNIEYRIFTPNDQLKIIREVGYAAKDEAGNVIRLFGTAQDITEHKRAEDALQQAQSRIESVLNSVADLHSLFDRDCRFLYANEAAVRAFGRPREQILGRTLWEVFPDIIGTQLERQYRRAMEERVHVAFEFHYPATDTWWENRFYPAPEGLSLFATDVTERKRAEEQLKHTTEQLRALSASLQAAREEEGTRIARELHDELGAALSSLRWDLEALDQAISQFADQPQFRGLRKKLEAMIRLTETTVNSVRKIASELRPPSLDDLGLISAIKWQARQFQDRTGIIVQCDCALEDLYLDREQLTALFRIYQEALTNIRRHAQATRVHVQTVKEAGDFILTINDNGRGITDEEKSGQRTLGLLGMRERAYLIGATVEITGVNGTGTVVTARIPMARAKRTGEGAC